MNVRLAVAAAVAALSLTASAAQEDAAEGNGTWVGTITTEGNVTTVVNQSGSVWGGTATLVEEVSIGSEFGDDPYLLGRIGSIAAHAEEIFVLDRQVLTIRVYDLNGTHLRDIGRGGNGPGELGSGERSASAMTFGPEGRLYVRSMARIETFSADGEYLDTWTMDGAPGRAGDFGMAVTESGAVVLAENIRCPERRPWPCGILLLQVSGDGPVEEIGSVPDLGYEVPRMLVSWNDERGPFQTGGAPPFVPNLVWNVDPSGHVVVGRADRYEFERRLGGGTTVISRYWEPTVVRDKEHDWHLQRERPRPDRAELKVESIDGYDLDDGLPRSKPAFHRFIPTRDGDIWVVRPGPGERLDGCDPDSLDQRDMLLNPCWRDTPIVDVFDADGRYLGAVEVPEILRSARSLSRMFVPQPFIRDGMVLAAVEDEAGTIMVKRYRLVLPGEQ